MSKSMYPVIGGKTRTGKAAYAVIDGVTRKIKAGYGVVGGVTKQFFMSESFFDYTGEYTESGATIGGTRYKLYTLTTSGVLNITGAGARFWMCGGGAGGQNATSTTNSYISGSGGGGGHVASGELSIGTWTITIGAGGASKGAGGDTTITGAKTHTAKGGDVEYGDGGSGAGSGVNYSSYGNLLTALAAGLGDGDSTYPFGLSSLKAHCAGGGGGAMYVSKSGTDYSMSGGNGGSNGAGGVKGTKGSSSAGAGGTEGGGKGGSGTTSTTVKGGNASFYGSGGGGGGFTYVASQLKGSGGSGYQGVVYIAIPA